MNGKIFLILLVLGSVISSAYYSSAFGGSSAYYTALFDDRGLASVVLRLDYLNTAESADSIELSIPGRNVKLIGAFARDECGSSCYNAGFDPVDVENIGGSRYRVDLGRTLAKGEEANLVIYYRAFGYVQDGIVGKSFAFETPRYGFDVEKTRVSVNVDNDLYLKEGEGTGNYNSYPVAYSGTTQLSSAMASTSYSSVSYARGMVKEKSTLLAGESFTVAGEYGDNKLLLFLPEIAGILLVVGIVGYAVHRKIRLDSPQRKGKLTDAAVFSFVAAVSFGVLLSLAIMLLAFAGVGISSMQPFALAFFVLWLGGIVAVFMHKNKDGRGLESAIMYVGFSFFLIPMMLMMAVWVYAILQFPF